MTLVIRSNYIFDTQTNETFAGYVKVEEQLITEVGPLEQLPEDVEILDFSEEMIVPGFIDCHMHFFLSALIHAGRLTQVSGTTEEEVAKQVADLPIVNGWKLGIGWYSSDFGQHVYPTKASLDVVCSDVPVMLISGDAHSIWLNSKGIAALEITLENVPQGISGAAFMENGELTGCLLEAVAITYLAKVLAPLKKKSAADYLAYMKHLNQMGITAIGDVALTGEAADDLVYPELFQQVAPTVRGSFFPAMRKELAPLREMYETYQSEKVQIGGVKQFFDGVTSTHTAYLKAEYATPYFTGDVGEPLIPTEAMRTLIFLANEQGWPIRIHVIGDQAIHQALYFYQESLEKFPLAEGKFNTLEHLEVMDPQDLPLVNQEQVLISVQPSHLLVGWETLEEEVGQTRASQMFPFQSFLDHGGKLAFGTDTPVVIDVTPLESIYYAVSRREKSGFPQERLMSKEVLTIEDALHAHTAGAAQALSRQDIGTIQVGKKADLCILSRNLLTCSEEEILSTKVLATMFDGEFILKKANH